MVFTKLTVVQKKAVKKIGAEFGLKVQIQQDGTAYKYYIVTLLNSYTEEFKKHIEKNTEDFFKGVRTTASAKKAAKLIEAYLIDIIRFRIVYEA